MYQTIKDLQIYLPDTYAYRKYENFNFYSTLISDTHPLPNTTKNGFRCAKRYY